MIVQVSEKVKNAPKRKPVLRFEELRKEDIPLVGGKCANLGEMIQAGIPVPPGFAVTAQTYEKFISETGIAEKIYKIIEEKTANTEMASKEVRKLIESTPIPDEMQKPIRKAYNELSKEANTAQAFVAVRSSATAEDLPGASFAGLSSSVRP